MDQNPFLDNPGQENARLGGPPAGFKTQEVSFGITVGGVSAVDFGPPRMGALHCATHCS